MASHVLVRNDITNAPTYSDATTCAGCAAFTNSAWCAELRAAGVCQKQLKRERFLLSLFVYLVRAGLSERVAREAIRFLRGGRE